MAVLTDAGATVAVTDADTLVVSGLPAAAIVEILTGKGVAFRGIAEHRATLEEAYMDLTRDSVEFRALAEETS
ncbi:MAG TPA: ABC transporter ATP-binding protein, partial [Phytomonospora sp.]